MTLKPCPFCGGKAELFTDETGVIEICVECKQCHARAEWSIDWNARVIPKGYVKVVRCGECKWWTKVEGENYGWCDELFSLLTADLPYTDRDFYCSNGEAKEAGE